MPCSCPGSSSAALAEAAWRGDPIAQKMTGIGGILPTIVWPSDVEAQKRRIDPTMATTDVAARTCAALTDAERTAWGRFYSSWRAFYAEPTPTFGAANKYDEALAYEAQLGGWQDQLRAKCTIPGPPPPRPEGALDLSALKWVAAAVIVVGIVYGVRTLAP